MLCGGKGSIHAADQLLRRFKINFDARPPLDNIVRIDALPHSGACALALEKQTALLGKTCSLAYGESREVGHEYLALGRYGSGFRVLFPAACMRGGALLLLRRKRIARGLDMRVAQEL